MQLKDVSGTTSRIFIPENEEYAVTNIETGWLEPTWTGVPLVTPVGDMEPLV